MPSKVILLVEDNPDDELLTVRALKQNNIVSEIIVARDGVEALDYVFATGPFADRDPSKLPEVVLLDMKIPKIDGMEVLKRIPADERTSIFHDVILPSSKVEQYRLEEYSLG